MTPNTLLVLPTKCELLKVVENKKERVYSIFEEASVFLCIEEMDLTEEWSRASPSVTPAEVASWATEVASWAVGTAMASGEKNRATIWKEYDRIYNLAKEEYKETKKIRGYKFLCPDGRNYVWISHFDIEFIENHNL